MSTPDRGEDRGSLVTLREVSELLGLRETNVLTLYLDVDPTNSLGLGTHSPGGEGL